ncbi:MAG: hypothetical protein J6V93_05220 [Clostridia bacterium]|nr:hypothetical protein [Clostridia bacterium]
MEKSNDIFKEKRTRKTTNVFKGLNFLENASEGEVISCMNFSSDRFPAICASSRRKYLSGYTLKGTPGSVGADEKLFYTDASKFYYDGVAYGDVTPGHKNFAKLKDTIVIFPDKAYFKRNKSYYYLHDKFVYEYDDRENITDCTELIAISESAPETAVVGDKYFNTKKLYIYTYLENGTWGNAKAPAKTDIFSLINTEYGRLDDKWTWNVGSSGVIQVETVAFSSSFEGECLKITFKKNGELRDLGLDNYKPGDQIRIRGLILTHSDSNDRISALNEGTVLRETGLGYIIVDNVGHNINFDMHVSTDTTSVIIERIVPSLDCVMNVGDRIWGARGSMIYACKPGDIKLWGNGNKVDTAVSIDVGVSGNITGCADFGGVPVFFTENAIIKVLKVYNGYSVSVTPAASLSAQNPKSIAFVNGSLYYLSDVGVMCYSGASPKRIDFPGGTKLEGMVGGSDGVKYYLSGKDKTYVYDPQNKVWYTESGVFTSFTRYASNLIGVKESNEFCQLFIVGLYGKSDGVEYDMGEKTLEFAPFFEDTTSKKTYSRLIIRAKLGKNTSCDVSLSYDGGDYTNVATLSGKGKICVYDIPLTPTRADFMQISLNTRASGMTLISITREFVLHENYN